MQRSWMPYLKIAQMRNHWDQVVGVENARHSQASRAARRHSDDPMRQPRMDHYLDVHDSAAADTIRRRLEGLTINEVRVTGPQQQGSEA